jgi:hypothetical protein
MSSLLRKLSREGVRDLDTDTNGRNRAWTAGKGRMNER